MKNTTNFNWKEAVDKAYTESFIPADEVTDTKTKTFFEKWVTSNFKNISDFHHTPDYCHIDGAVFCGQSNTVLCFEFKHRNIPSTQYGDAIMTQKKYLYLKDGKEKLLKMAEEAGDDIKVVNLLVTIYTDGVMCFWKAENYVCEGRIRMTQTTEKTYGSKRMIEAPTVIYKVDKALINVSVDVEEIYS